MDTAINRRRNLELPEFIYFRNRLFDKLNQGQKNRFVWICGPPGSGKTTLIRSYLFKYNIPFLWHQITEQDKDHDNILHSMALAYNNSVSRQAKALPLQKDIQCTSYKDRETESLNDLLPDLENPCLFILDDCHHVHNKELLDKIIHRVFASAPDEISVFFISRAMPSPEIMNHYGSQIMYMLGWHDLRLTIQESKDIIQMHIADVYTDELATCLHKEADGWITGLIMILKKIKDDGGDPHVVKSPLPQEMIEYFTHKVFECCSSATQGLLLKTSFLPRITIESAHKLTKLLSAETILEDLVQNHFFTIKVPQGIDSFEYHHQFRKFLQAKVKDTYPSEIFSEIVCNSATCLSKKDQHRPDIASPEEIDRWDDLVQVIKDCANSMLKKNQNHKLDECIACIPCSILNNDPHLLYCAGCSILEKEPGRSREYFEKAFYIFQRQRHPSGLFLTWSGIVKSYIYCLGNFKILDEWLFVLDTLKEDYPEFPSAEIRLEVESARLLALIFRHPHIPEIDALADNLLSTEENDDIQTNILSNLILHRVIKGDFNDLSSYLNLLKQIAMTSKINPFFRITAKFAESIYYNYSGEYEKCLDAVIEGLELAEDSNIHLLDTMFIGIGASTSLNHNEMVQARDFLKKMDETMLNLTLWESFIYHLLKCRESLINKDIEGASHHLESAYASGIKVGVPINQGLYHLAKAYVKHAQGEHENAYACLANADKIADLINSGLLKFSVLLARAYFSLEPKETQPGIDELRQALIKGRKQGYTISFFHYPHAILKLTTIALKQNFEVDYMQDIIRKSNLIPGTQQLHLENWPWRVRIYTLGQFIVEINGQSVNLSGKMQQKPLSVLMALIALGGIQVSCISIVDILWPDVEGDLAHQSLATNLHRLRKLLGINNAVELSNGCLSLNPEYCWVDAWTFESLINDAKGLLNRYSHDYSEKKAFQNIKQALDLYKGRFLSSQSHELWTISLRERLHAKFNKNILLLGSYLERTEDFRQAIECYEKALDVDDLNEEFYYRCIKCNAMLGQKSEAIAVYERCKKVLTISHGAKLSLKTEELKNSLFH